MRSLFAAFLIPQLVALPVTQGFGQATQQEARVTQTGEPTVLLSAPVVDSNTVLLLAPGTVEVLPAADSLQVREPPTPKSKTQKIVTVVVAAIVAARAYGKATE
jgi:hypothetical protein